MQREEEAAADVEEDSEEDSEDDDGSDVDDGEDGEGGSEDEEDEEDEDEEVGVFLVFPISFFLCMLCLWARWESAVKSDNALRWMTGKRKHSHSSFQFFLVLSEISMMLTGLDSFLPLPLRFLAFLQHQYDGSNSTCATVSSLIVFLSPKYQLYRQCVSFGWLFRDISQPLRRNSQIAYYTTTTGRGL